MAEISQSSGISGGRSKSEELKFFFLFLMYALPVQCLVMRTDFVLFLSHY